MTCTKVFNYLTNSPAPADSSKTEPTKEHELKVANTSNMNVSCSVDQTPDIQSIEKLIEKVEKDGNPNPSVELQDINVDNLKYDPVQTPEISCELTSTEKPIDKVEQDGEPNSIVDLQDTNISCDRMTWF